MPKDCFGELLVCKDGELVYWKTYDITDHNTWLDCIEVSDKCVLISNRIYDKVKS